MPISRLRVLTPRAKSAYRRLQKYDVDWLRRHCPKVQQPRRLGREAHWNDRDHALAPLIRQAAAELKDLNPPVRLTKKTLVEVIRSWGATTWRTHAQCIQKPHVRNRLPLTEAALDKVLETNADFRYRKEVLDREAKLRAERSAQRRVGSFHERPGALQDAAVRATPLIGLQPVAPIQRDSVPTLRSSEVVALLKVTRATIRHWRLSGRLLAMQCTWHTFLFPTVQFDASTEDGRIAGLDQVVRVLGEMSPMAKAQWMQSPQVCLGGRPAADLLRVHGASALARVLDCAKAAHAQAA